MDSGITFPSEADTIHKEALEFRRLSSTERFLAILDLIASGEALLNQSPNRARSLSLHDEHEALWQRAQRELFARHAR
jgi:hypothetical protein